MFCIPHGYTGLECLSTGLEYIKLDKGSTEKKGDKGFNRLKMT